jgi:glycerol kinase
MSHAVQLFLAKGHTLDSLVAVGITNQRETTVVWDSVTGESLTNALVWQDTRTSNLVNAYKALNREDEIKRIAGLPLSTYFSAVKLRWLIDNVPIVAEKLRAGRLSFGTVDSWLMYRLTGGADGGIHVTDPTNASRTLLLDIRTLKYSDTLIDFFGLQGIKLPEIRSSAEVYGTVRVGALRGVQIAGCLGDQSAALVGHRGIARGAAKNTYGTGYNNLLLI